MNYLSQFLSRLGSETPKFFRKIVAIAITIGAIGAGLISMPDTWLVKLPFDFHVIGGYMIAIGAVAGVIAKSTTTDVTLQKQGGSNPPTKTTTEKVD